MARIRTIKPEFWTSAKIMECSTNARLLFIGLWNFSDDTGRHPWQLKQIKAEIYPGDPFTELEIQGMLSELSKNNLITKYTVDSNEYLLVHGWDHQRIDKPQDPKYPAPIQDDSKNIPRTLPPDSIGKDGNGKDRGGESDKPPRSNGRFIKPSIPEIREYCEQIESSINPSTFFNHYESVGWKVGKNPMKDWKSAVRGWTSRDNK